MQCQQCGRENRSTARFCDTCGVELAILVEGPAQPTPGPEDDSPVAGFQNLMASPLFREDLASSQFVGRHREMELLNAALDQASYGHGRLVMLVGEPGIGKTRTAQEFVDQARAAGAQALWGWCYEDQGAPPYWPWIQPIRQLVQQAQREQLQAWMGPGAASIAEIVPEVREKLPGLEPLPGLEAGQARFRCFDGIVGLFKRVAQERPLVIVLDDLHYADSSSLLLLEFIAQQLEGASLLLVGTYRDMAVTRSHPLARALGSLVRAPGFQRLQLKRLTHQEVGEFIAVSSEDPTPELVQTVYERTGGNLLFLVEVVRLLAQEGGGLASDTLIPEGVRDAIGTRLNSLSALCNETLTIASVMGAKFDFRPLLALSRVSQDRLLEALEEALAEGIIEELSQEAESYQFTHPLIRETLVSELSLSRRVRVHARIGEAMEQLYQDELGAHAAVLAHHFAAAEPVLGPEKPVRYSLLAGQQALAAHAYEDALAHFQRGLAAKRGLASSEAGPSARRSEGFELIQDAETAELMVGLGIAQAATLGRHQFEGAVDNLRLAFNFYVESGDVSSAVTIAQYPFPYWARRLRSVVSLIENALSLIPSDSHQAGHLLSFYGQVLGARTENYESAQRAFEQALNIAHREADAALEMRTLTWAAATDCFHLRFAQSLERSTQALQLSHIVHDPYVAADARHWCAVVLTITGDLEQASVQARAGLELAENLHDRQRLAAVLWNHQAIAQLKGDWEAARESCERGLAAWPRDPRFLGNRASLEYQVGNAELGASYLGQLTEAARAAELEPNIEHAILATEIPFIGRIIGSLDNAEAAEQAGERVLSSSSATPLAALIARIGLGLLAVQREDSAAARRYYADLETTLRGITFVELSGQHLLGLLAQTMGSLDAAEGHFQEALDFCRRAGISPELGWSALDYARLLLQRGRPDDHARAAALLEVARDIASRFHLPPLEQQVALVQPQHRPLADTLSVYPDGLTHREVEVLGLIALGKTNREIAEDLFISLHTVIRHVSNILSKTGAANRAEAASYALRHKLLQ